MNTPPTLDARLGPQYEGMEHRFLEYESVDVHFIYSFSWDITKLSWKDLKDHLLDKKKDWKNRPLHERIMWGGEERLYHNYQPNLAFKTICLQHYGEIRNVDLLLPFANDPAGQPKSDEIKIRLRYVVRLFETGGGICTFKVSLSSGEASFRNIHAVLHLTQNTNPEGKQDQQVITDDEHLTRAFLRRSLPELAPGEDFPFPSTLDFNLDQMFAHLLSTPPEWMPDRFSELWNDKEVLDTSEGVFQSPFVFSVAQVSHASFLRFRKQPSMDTNKEISSIYCKLTLDNRHIEEDFHHISEDYITHVLQFNTDRKVLLNLCLDRRLFFAVSRRGAIALTASLSDTPTYFVVPSLLNLLEINRARWHVGSIVGAHLDAAIASLGAADSYSDPLAFLRAKMKWRILAGSFLRDPVPYLFDGGSITEIAEEAECLFWLDRLQAGISAKYEILDRLSTDYLELERTQEILKIRSEFNR